MAVYVNTIFFLSVLSVIGIFFIILFYPPPPIAGYGRIHCFMFVFVLIFVRTKKTVIVLRK